MYRLNYSLLLTLLWAASCSNSVAESSNKSEESTFLVDPKENEIFLHPIVPEPNLSDFTEEVENRTRVSSSTNETKSATFNSKADRIVENATFSDIKPFLLFPILPYLFPPREEEENSRRSTLATVKNETSKIEGGPTDVKPFIVFDFAFNIRRIPISNATGSFNDSKIINVKKLSMSNVDDSNMDSLKDRRRRNTKIETPGFFDDAPLFPDSELDEFLPKPDFFFPDLPFHPKPAKKLSRRKRDPKKTELKNDLKSFFDAFDEAFMRTKREMEWADPILNFLRGAEQTQFEEEKKDADDLFGQLPVIQEKPRVKWRIQRNIKRLNNDRQGGVDKAKDSPTIIVDKVVKIGEFHVHDEGREKNKKKKRGLIDIKRKFQGREDRGEITRSKDDQNVPRNIFELIKQEGSRRKKRVHPIGPNSEKDGPEKTEPRGIRSSPQMNVSILTPGANKVKDKKETKHNPSNNNTEKIISLMKMFDSVKEKMGQELRNMRTATDNVGPNDKYVRVAGKGEGLSLYSFQESLKKNLTELLKQFLELNKYNTSPSEKRLEDAKLYDWVEREAVLNSPGENIRERRQNFSQEPDGKDEKLYANLGYLFFNVTVPTMLVFGVILIICLFSLQAKGKLCKSLFRSRQILILNEETVNLKEPETTKVRTL